jgi:Flp pilus assembly protein TadG
MAMSSPKFRSTNNKGQALIETAFVLFILVLLVFGITEFGRAMYTKNTLNNLARGAARVAVVTNPLISVANTNLSSGVCSGTSNPVYKYVCSNITPGIGVSNVWVQIAVTDPTNAPRAGNAVTGDSVTITTQLRNFTSAVPKLIKITNTLTGRQSMRYE